MEKEKFNQIIRNYTKVVEECEEFINLFNGNFDLRELKVKDLEVLIEKARALQGKTNSILQSELYHLIGMGNLTPTQLAQLCAIVKKISSSRSYFKPVACYVLNKLPEVPDKSNYKCNIAGVKLESVFTK